MAKCLAVAAFLAALRLSAAASEEACAGGTTGSSLLQVGQPARTTGVLETQDEISSGGSKIIVLGDSNARWSCGDVSRFCGGSSAVNMAMGGSTAQHWTDGKCWDPMLGQKESDPCPEGASCCNATRAFDPKFGSGYTHAWVIVGGNEFIDAKPCGSLKGAALQAPLETAITKIHAAGPAGMKIVMTGYVKASSHTSPFRFEQMGCGSDPEIVHVLNGAIEAAAKSLKAKGLPVAYVDPAYALGATPTTFSPMETHSDAIHLNSKGYCRLFSMPQMQAELGCSGTPCSVAGCLGVTDSYSHWDGCSKSVGGCPSMP